MYYFTILHDKKPGYKLLGFCSDKRARLWFGKLLLFKVIPHVIQCTMYQVRPIVYFLCFYNVEI